MNSGYNKFSYHLLISAFVFFILVAITGVWIRALPWIQSIIPYENLLHAHSHTALLGWAFLLITSLTFSIYRYDSFFIRINFYFLIFTVIGMFVTFLYQSYGAFSIAFSTLFIIAAYYLLFRVYRSIDPVCAGSRLLKRAIIWFYISTLGIWFLAPSGIFLGKSHWLYNSSIQFFLHFQINGWLLYGTLGLLLHKKHLNSSVLKLLDLSLILTAFLPFYWIDQHFIFYVLNSIGTIIQFIVILFFINVLIKMTMRKTVNKFLIFSIIVFLLFKEISQMVALDPIIAAGIVSNRNFILTFLHLILIGIVSFGLMNKCLELNIILNKQLFQMGLFALFIAFICTEIILLLLGLNFYSVYSLTGLLLFSIIMLVGVTCILISIIQQKKPLSIAKLPK